MRDFETLTHFIESVLAVSLSESIGNTSDGVPVPAEIVFKTNKIIQGVILNETEFRANEGISDNSNTEDDIEHTDWQM